jgi:TRAP-type C4-dicarboxylate transport system permease small subunit
VISEFFVSAVRKASGLAGILSAAMIGVSILVVCQMVFVRYFISTPTTWQTELVTYLLVGATLIGCPYVLMIRGHVSVDLLPHYLSPYGRKRLSLVGAVAGIFFCAVLLLSSFDLWYNAWSGEWVSDTVWAVALWIPYSALPLGFGLMLLQYVADVLVLIKGGETP